MNRGAQAWCTWNMVPGMPGIDQMLPGTRRGFHEQIRQEFTSSTTSSRHSCSNSLLIVFKIVPSTDLPISGLKRSSPPSTCSWSSVACESVFFSCSMISISCSTCCWADGLIHGWFWYSLQSDVFHGLASIGTTIYVWNMINSIRSITTYINTITNL